MKSTRAPNILGERNQIAASVVGLVAAALLVVHSRQTGEAIMPSYLFVWLFLLGISLGAMALLFLHNLTGGDWGDAIRPLLVALVRLIPYCAHW